MVLRWETVLRLQFEWCGLVRPRRTAPRLGRTRNTKALAGRSVGPVDGLVKVGVVRGRGIGDAHERGGISRRLISLADYDCDWLVGEQDAIGVQRTEWVARRRDIIPPVAVEPSCVAAILVREHGDHA
jgi:hypothetical protein